MNRKSKKRDKILEILKEGGIMSADEIFQNIDVDLATIYRNLNKFVEQDIVREIKAQKGITHYEFKKDIHHHIICNECGEVKHVEVDPKKLKSVFPDMNFEDCELEIVVRGKCK